MSTSTERGNRGRSSGGAIVTLLCLVVASSGAAHVQPGREGNREIVRLQGYREKLPTGLQAQREVVLSILGEEHKFYLTDWRRFRLTEDEQPGETELSRFAVQAERAVLVRLSSARPEQRVTILAERRATGSDIFVLALDLCPPE